MLNFTVVVDAIVLRNDVTIKIKKFVFKYLKVSENVILKIPV